MATDREGKALVIGCGPAGSAAAITLARAGWDVKVLERSAFPRDKTCGDAVSNEAVALLHELGAGEECFSGPHAIVRQARALFPNASVVSRRYDPPGAIIARLRLDAALANATRAAGAQLLEHHLVRELIVRDERVIGAAGEGFSLEADVVLAADGHGSLARKALGHAKPGERYLAVARRAYFEGVHFDAGEDTADHYFEHHLPFGYGWLFPDVDGRANVGVYQRSDHFQAGPKALDRALDRFIAAHPERFARARQVGPRRTWPLPLAPAPWTLSRAGLVAIGDAGNHIDPLSGEGIWQALRSGQAAAESIIERGPDDFASTYAAICEAEIAVPSRRRARVQAALRLFVGAHLYRFPPARWVLGWGYGRQSLEASKSL